MAPRAAPRVAGQPMDLPWERRVERVVGQMQGHAERLMPPEASDRPDHPRRVLADDVAYSESHRHHTDYPKCRAKGWPIGSGVTESAVKQFNKRVKGTDQFWGEPGAEAILALRSLWLPDDGRWDRCWGVRPAYPKAA